jgi:hypothetical protein
METRNVTLSMRKEVLRKAKLVAVKRGTSPSRLMSEALEAIADEEDGYEQAKRRQLALKREGLDLGTYGRPVTSRDELHDLNPGQSYAGVKVTNPFGGPPA